MKLIAAGFVGRFTCILWVAVLLFVIPVQAFSNEPIIISKADQKSEVSFGQKNVGLDVEKQTRGEFEDYHRGEKALPENAGYIVIGVLAIGFVVVVILIMKNISNSAKIPDP